MCEYILFRIAFYFSKYFLEVQIDEKVHTDRDLIFGEKRQKALEKNLCNFIRINTSKRYDEDYDIGRTQTFISKCKNRRLKKLEKESNKEIKELVDEIKKPTLKFTSQTT